MFEPGDKVMPGVKALDTSGHTPGHVSFLLKSGKDKLLVIGDLIHFSRIQLPLPEVAVKYDVDPAKAVQARYRPVNGSLTMPAKSVFPWPACTFPSRECLN